MFKLYFADTGLLVSMLDDEAQENLRANKNLGVYKGSLYENMVGEALVKQGYRLFYYKRHDSTLEEDFLSLRELEELVAIHDEKDSCHPSCRKKNEIGSFQNRKSMRE